MFSNRYFVDEGLLSRVPELFWVLAGTLVVMQVIAIFLLREPSQEESQRIIAQAPSKSNDVMEDDFSLTPKQMLKTSVFYKMWISFFTLNVINGFLNNYQKSFGQIYIHDDTFFVFISTGASFCNGTARIIWGYVYDKTGFKVRY